MISYDTSKKGKYIEIENRSMVAWEQRLTANGNNGIWGEDGNVLKLDYCDGCTTT